MIPNGCGRHNVTAVTVATEADVADISGETDGSGVLWRVSDSWAERSASSRGYSPWPSSAGPRSACSRSVAPTSSAEWSDGWSCQRSTPTTSPPVRSRWAASRSLDCRYSRSSRSSAAGSAPGRCSSGCRPSYRRQVTRRYLELPLAWHRTPRHRHPAVQRQRRRRGDLVPDRADAVRRGHHRDAGRRRCVALFLTDWTFALVGLAIFPALFGLNVVYSRLMSPRIARAQALRAEISAIAHESFDGALVVKTMGREAEETERFAATAQRAARRDDPGRPGAGPVRPAPRRAAEPGHPGRAAGRRGAPAPGRGHRRPTWSASRSCSPCWPSRSGRSAGCSPSCRAAWSAGTGCAVSRRPPATCAYGDGRCADRRARRRGLDVSGVDFSYPMPATPVLQRRHLRRAGRAHRGPGRPDRLGQVHPRRAGRPAGRPGRPARCSVDGVDVRDLSARRSWPRRSALVPQVPFVFDDTVRGNVALGRAGHRRRSRLGGAAGWPRPTGSSPAARRARHHGRRARHVALRRAAPAAHPGPGAGRSAPAAGPRRRDQRGRPAGGGGDPGRAAAPPVARRSWWWPTGGPPSRSPTRWSTSSAAG